jgi:hypothetical protein
MSDACVVKTRAALGSWLTTHEAQLPLRLSLRENGYGPLLPEAVDKRDRPRITA